MQAGVRAAHRHGCVIPMHMAADGYHARTGTRTRTGSPRRRADKEEGPHRQSLIFVPGIRTGGERDPDRTGQGGMAGTGGLTCIFFGTMRVK